MTPRAEADKRLLAVLTHARTVSEALASSDEPDALLRAFAAACLDETVDFCAVDLRDGKASERRVAAALAADLGTLPTLLQERCDVPYTGTTPDLCWSTAREAVVASGAAAVLGELGIVSFGRVPLLVGGELVGTVLFASRHEGSLDGTALERAQVSDLVARAGTALQSAWLRGDAVAANGLRDEFLSIVSHELRTPLSTILGWAKLLREGGLSAERSANALAVIHRSALAQSQIIDELLDASRVLGGHLTLSLEQASVATIVHDALASIADAAAKKRLIVELHSDDPCMARVDADRVRQLVGHLISNALKFTAPGGRVDVSMSCDDDRVVLTVTDTGIGIDPAFLPAMFDRFRQADGAATRRHGGMGLGLAMVRRIVEAHEGEAHAESAGLGKGATFRVSLPRRAQASLPVPLVPVASLTPTGKSDLRGVRVLVVDDQRDVCEFAGTALALRGAQVTLAGSAAEALTALGGGAFDLLLSDIAMPHEDGVSLVRKALVAQPSLRTVALSAFSQPAAVKRAEAAGFERYLVKPMDPGELVRELSELLHSPKAA